MSDSIGGIDITLQTEKEAFRLRTVLTVVTARWPQGVFQDANEETTRPLKALVNGKGENIESCEFFVYRDQISAQSWNQEGRSPTNGNAMLHFLIQDMTRRPNLLQITIVLDELTSEMIQMCYALNSVLEPLLPGKNGRPKTAHPTSLDRELRAAGCQLTRTQFYHLLDEIWMALYPGWTADELACHPLDAQQFCSVVRMRAGAPVPDHSILKALLNRRKRGRR